MTVVVAQPLLRSTLQVILLTDADNNGVPSPGDTLLYTMVVRNDGNIAATTVQIADTLDPNTNLVIGSVRTTQGTATWVTWRVIPPWLPTSAPSAVVARARRSRSRHRWYRHCQRVCHRW